MISLSQLSQGPINQPAATGPALDYSKMSWDDAVKTEAPAQPQPPQQPSLGQQYSNLSNAIGDFSENAVKTAGANFLSDVGQTGVLNSQAGQKVQQQITQSNHASSNADLTYLKALQSNLQQAQSTKNTARVQQLQTALQNFHLSNGTKLSDAFPILNKSNEQITGDTIGAITTALTAGLGNIATPATVLGRVGLGALEGSGVGGSYGVSGAMSQNASAKDVVKSGVENAAIGAGGGALVAGLPDALDSLNNSYNTPSPQLSETAPIEPKITPEQQAVSQSQSKVNQANQVREGASSEAVQGVKDINTQVAAHKATLGEQFASDAQKLEQGNPELKLNLTNDQVKALNSLKEGKNFVLPKSLDQSEAAISMKGNEVNLGPNVRSQLESELGKAGATNAVELSPTETQDLLRELNRSTYKEMADGTRQIDQQRIGITNDIKTAASEAFGKPWEDIYSRYAQGRTAIDKIDSFVNLDPRATAADFNKQLETILKQSKTPEGKLLLQQSVNEYKQTSGIDLTNPIKAVQQIADKQTALDAANDNLTQAQRDLFKAQREADIQKIKGGYVKRLVTSSVSPERMGGRLAWGVLGIGIIYPLIHIIQKSLSSLK